MENFTISISLGVIMVFAGVYLVATLNGMETDNDVRRLGFGILIWIIGMAFICL